MVKLKLSEASRQLLVLLSNEFGDGILAQTFPFIQGHNCIGNHPQISPKKLQLDFKSIKYSPKNVEIIIKKNTIGKQKNKHLKERSMSDFGFGFLRRSWFLDRGGLVVAEDMALSKRTAQRNSLRRVDLQRMPGEKNGYNKCQFVKVLYIMEEK